MEQHGVRRILVVNADNTLAGIVSLGDILAFTGNSASRGKKQAAKLNVEPVLDMLKNISIHHSAPRGPLTNIQDSQSPTV